MQKFQDVVQDSQGRPVAGAVIAVLSYPGGSPATVYENDVVGAAYVPVTDAFGAFFFYAPDGDYSYTVTVFNVLRRTVTDVQIVDVLTRYPLNNPVFTGVVSADGFKFPTVQVPSADVKVLDDYEEGAWTPVVTATVGTITTVGVVAGRYVKIGALVTCYFYCIITTNGTGAQSVVIGGLPFASGSHFWTGVAREASVTGNQISVSGPTGSNVVGLQDYDNAYPGADGVLFIGQCQTMLIP